MSDNITGGKTHDNSVAAEGRMDSSFREGGRRAGRIGRGGKKTIALIVLAAVLAGALVFAFSQKESCMTAIHRHLTALWAAYPT